jgi:hypothetical protein
MRVRGGEGNSPLKRASALPHNLKHENQKKKHSSSVIFASNQSSTLASKNPKGFDL